MSDEYTPTMEDLISAYASYIAHESERESKRAEARRTIAAHDAEVARAAAEKAWDEAAKRAYGLGARYMGANPYRADRLAAGN